MKIIDKISINGRFVTPHGHEEMELVNPSNQQVSTRLRLADEHDARDAIAAARQAFSTYSHSPLEQRVAYLERLHAAVKARTDELIEVMIEEYGGPRVISEASTKRAAQAFLNARQVMLDFPFHRKAGKASVVMEPFGVVGLITPWNANSSFICGKLAMALAAGSTAVIKPSELSAAQTQILTECFHAADLPPGLFNIVTGRGEVVGAEITRHPDIGKISFTGSTAVGKAIARGAVDTLKRVTLELGGKSANILLDDANLDEAMPLAIRAAFHNSGQACVAGSRLLVPESRLEAVKAAIRKAVSTVRVGDPKAADTWIGPLVSSRQYERVQNYIRLGQAEGAELIAGGEGHPEGLEQGYFVRPTIFAGVTMKMRIAQEEIFGPVLTILTYRTEDEAVQMANDTVYGLQAYVSSGQVARAQKIAARLVAGRVFINGLYDEPEAPFGGFKQSGIGREFGSYGLEAYLEPKAIMAPG